MARYDFGNFIAGFGKGLIESLETQQKLEEQRKQREQELAFQLRQLSLTDAYRKAQLESDNLRNKALIEEKGAELLSKYTPVYSGLYGGIPEGSVSGEQIQKQFPTIGSVFAPNMYYMPKQDQSKLEDPYGKSFIGVGEDGRAVFTTYNKKTGRWEDVGEVYREANNNSNNGSSDNATLPGLNDDNIASDVGEVQKLIELYKLFGDDASKIKYTDKDNKEIEIDKKMWRVIVQEPLHSLLTKASLSENDKLIGSMWANTNSIVNEAIKKNPNMPSDEKARLKKQIMYNQLEELKRQNVLTPAQIRALELYIEAKTR